MYLQGSGDKSCQFDDYGIHLQGATTGETRTTCPQCSQSRRKSRVKCLAVNVDKGTWLCHHCGWSGGLGRKSEYIPVDSREPVYQKPEFKEADLPDKTVNYFANRGISLQTLKHHRISRTRKYMPAVQKTAAAIQFPYFVDGEVVNVKYRDANKNFCLEKGAKRVLYGYDDIDDIATIVTEGEIDKLSLSEIGMPNCVSVPDGAPPINTSNYASKFNFLESAEDKLADIRKFIIAVDADGPGVRLKKELIRRLGAWRCWVAEWPQGCKDANEVLVKHGRDRLAECIDGAKPVPVEGIYGIEDFKNRILDAYFCGFTPGVKTGWDAVDEHYSVRPGEFTLVTGIPGSGKSEWLDAVMVNIARNEGWTFGVLSLENLPLERHFAKLAEKHINLPFHNTRDYQQMSQMDLNDAIQWGMEHFRFLIPPEDDMTLNGVLELARVLIFRHGISGLVIDPWNELDHTRSANISETDYISQCLGKIRRFARESEIHIWIVAHPLKLKKKEDGTYPVPTPYDISGSANWWNKGDNIIAVHRPNPKDKEDRRVGIHVQKIRFKEVGRPGVGILNYDVVTGNYYSGSLVASPAPLVRG